MSQKHYDDNRFQGWWRQEVIIYRGDDVVERGTVKEIAERWNCQKRYIYWLTMPVAHRRADIRKDQTKALRAIAVEAA